MKDSKSDLQQQRLKHIDLQHLNKVLANIKLFIVDTSVNLLKEF